nr:MAG TPA_asm: hypothetical protein [Caudoviricetes sp.]
MPCGLPLTISGRRTVRGKRRRARRLINLKSGLTFKFLPVNNNVKQQTLYFLRLRFLPH